MPQASRRATSNRWRFDGSDGRGVYLYAGVMLRIVSQVRLTGIAIGAFAGWVTPPGQAYPNSIEIGHGDPEHCVRVTALAVRCAVSL